MRTQIRPLSINDRLELYQSLIKISESDTEHYYWLRISLDGISPSAIGCDIHPGVLIISFIQRNFTSKKDIVSKFPEVLMKYIIPLNIDIRKFEKRIDKNEIILVFNKNHTTVLFEQYF
ncbi:MAG: hypothetical protein JXB49_09630 [Bacteroidales bacterium]|nr:hypothetical protein [Bacteroidales bacterium]